jgi:aminoglycoside N3'-acetyltransferase/dienelactone hydrolase
VVTRGDLLAGLSALGLGPGDVVLCHSSLRSFGLVEGGAATVVGALLDTLGATGTLIAPIFRRFFWEGPDQVWDREQSPSLMGAISECLRTWPGACRSSHGPHPVAAVGPLAAELTRRRHRSDYALDSPLARLVDLDGWVLLVGVGFGVCTLMHLLEERLEIPYRRWVDLVGTVIEDGVAERQTFPLMMRHDGVNNDFGPLAARLVAAGLVRQTQVGSGCLQAVRARDVHDVGLAGLRRDPLLLVSAATRDAAADYLPQLGPWLQGLQQDPGSVRPATHPLAARLATLLHVRQPRQGLTAEVRDAWAAADGLWIEDLRLHGGPGAIVPAFFARPAAAGPPRPAVLCLHGTGDTREGLMEPRLTTRGTNLLGWARELARQGFAVLVITQLAHPPRPEPWGWDWPKLLPLFGQTAMGQLVADALAATDYLADRSDVDANRIGVAGYSLGGIAAFYSLVIEARLAGGAVFCGGVGSVAALVAAGQDSFHSVYFYPPGLLSAGLDHPQLVPALAARPLWLAATEGDAGMPPAGVAAFADRMRAASPAADDRFHLHSEPGPHALTLGAFTGAAAWMRQQWGDCGPVPRT